MTPLYATQAVLEQTAYEPIHIRATELEKTAMSDKASWFSSALAQLRTIEQEAGNIPGIGDLRVQTGTALRVRRLLTEIRPEKWQELPTPELSSFSGGGVSVTWQIGPKELRIVVFPDDAISFSRSIDDRIHDDGLLGVDGNTNTVASWLLEAC